MSQTMCDLMQAVVVLKMSLGLKFTYKISKLLIVLYL